MPCPLLIAFAAFIQCEAELLNGGDHDGDGVVFPKQTAPERVVLVFCSTQPSCNVLNLGPQTFAESYAPTQHGPECLSRTHTSDPEVSR